MTRSEVQGWLDRYAERRALPNLCELRFDDAGRCAAFVEWYMEHPRSNE